MNGLIQISQDAAYALCFLHVRKHMHALEDLACRARVIPASLRAFGRGAHAACTPRLRLRQSFLRTLLVHAISVKTYGISGCNKTNLL